MTMQEPDNTSTARRPLVGESFALRGRAALDEIFRLQYDQLLRFCRIRLGNVPDAEDLVQEAFLSVRRAYPDKGVEELRPLLFTALRNLTLDYLKSGYAKRARSSDAFSDLGDVLACPRSPTPETQMIDIQSLAIVQDALARLEPRKRDALLLSRLERLTHKEIAVRLSVSPRTVRSDITEAIAVMAKSLASSNH
ncbi:ECF subfamily RNA polymerase sigma factor [Hyphomonas oceanitis SCH89]|uniref:ECF subfamily RNA polymerase sigma factor n=1 Tax=Hyphomonas oceanitis SCH89 TaxID=1280953 RepID=A0A059G1S6_9PROT|nr:ECF subfamily RNA polymerase sigma factor [Hyphomonas oceanitis SCH89]|tara:strand:- start:326 stop:910 length:585 start_codon:yes stop_codon:yes gene_type:complete